MSTGRKQKNEPEEVKESVSGPDIESLTIEEGFACLEEILEKLEDPDISLEASFESFERGMKVLKAVSGKIDAVEKKVMVLNGDGSESEFEPEGI